LTNPFLYDSIDSVEIKEEANAMAKNRPYGDNRRQGAVRDRIQVFNPHNNRWTKIDTNTNLFIDQKSDKEPFKGVRKEK
jgi:hypothetical protein